MPNPKPNESKEDFISRFMSSEEAKKDYPDKDQRLAVANSMWKKHSKSKESSKRLCLKGLKLKEEEGEIIIHGLAATTHPDRVGDILSEHVIDQIVDYINDTGAAGGNSGAYRSVSLFHDWIKEEDPALDEVAFLKPEAKKVKLDDGHYGVDVQAVLNKHYKGPMTVEEVKDRIDYGQIAGFSIEYDDGDTKTVDYNGQTYNFIESLNEFGGLGLARARLIANPHAVFYKEIAEKVKEEKTMAEESKSEDAPKPEEAPEEEKKDETPKEEPKQETKEADVSALIKSLKEDIVKEIKEGLQPQSKVVKQTKESAKKMESKEIPLSIKEMKESLRPGKMDIMRFKEAVSTYFAENPELDMQYKEQIKTTGIPLRPTLQTKCVNNKLVITGGLKVKGTLDTTTNAGAYTESPVEFADIFVPGLVDTFNNQANLFGALPKIDNPDGSMYYGWRIKADQSSDLFVDPDDPSVVKDPVSKYKMRTPIKEARIGVSVSDFTLHHARGAIGDLMMIEAEARMNDLMRDINNKLFAETADGTGNDILGLEAVADGDGNTTLYGKDRSTTNRLAPDAAADTYTAVGGALTTEYMRKAARKPEIAGASRANLRFVMNPLQRDKLYELEDGNLNYYGVPHLGFDGTPKYDGIPIIVDSSCNTDDVFCIDLESDKIVISRGPQLIGLAKVGAAEEAYISIYLAHVYEQPRRIHMLQNLNT